ncbi:P-loop containing nucleoside triphosphate hydrolase protein [Metschnikowia bicuspidata]|uniref:Structural maintenance of chromosomes protein 5 n=1 Tax=Metschnikowia bicuspidata TaxID=27322 RepID=A0A4P9ZK62_9ASCO|nr:P-loop containing nucleoside triphosphate hydrolase protein [Metschnikowia bicuspidata]
MSSSPEPRAKRRKANGSATVFTRQFKAGNIIRLRVWNFTTYNYGVFNLSPSLNMIIGPNGTGKSTFVAAVCLALGGKVDLIRRTKIDSMIKSGEKESRIEATLCMGPDKPPTVIERVLTLKLTKSKWKLNGSPSDVREVCSIVKGLNIQLDNLCHFLPQERVAEFASLSPEKLLLEMERTIGDNTLLEKHQLLIDLDASLLDVTGRLESAEEHTESLKENVERYSKEAERFQEYEEKSREISHHKKLLPYAKLQDLKVTMANLKVVRDSAKEALKNFHNKSKPLAEYKEEAINEGKRLSEELEAASQKVTELTRSSTSSMKEISLFQKEIKDLKNTINNLLFRTENQKVELQKTIEEKDRILSKLLATTPVDTTYLASLVSLRQEKHEEKAKIEEDLDSIKFQITALNKEIEANQQRIREEKKRLASNDRLEVFRSTGTRYRKELMEMSYKAHVLLRSEAKKQGFEYFEAPVISCRVTDSRYAKYFERIVDNMSLFALFFEDESQYQKVSSFLPKEANVPMRVCSNKMPEDKISRDQLRRLGFDGLLSDFITGPEPVIRALKQKCFIHIIPVAPKPMSPELIQKFIDFITLKPGFKNSRFAAESSLFQLTRSKHGSKQTLYQTEHIPEAQLMAAEGLTEEAKGEIHRRIVSLEDKIKLSTGKRDEKQSNKDELLKSLSASDAELNDLDKEVRNLKKQKETKSKLEDTLQHTESKIDSLRRATTEDYSDQISLTESELMQKYLGCADMVEKNADELAQVATSKIEVKKLELYRQHLENKVLAFQGLQKELEKTQEQLAQQYLTAKSKYDEYKKGDAANEAKQQNLSPEEREFVKVLAEKYHSQGSLSEQFVLQVIERLEDEISVLPNVDHGILTLLKNKKADLEMAETQLPALKRKKVDLETRILQIYGPWVEELSAVVEKISRTFQQKFVAVASDGQVELVKAERYKDYKLEILVKFRENSELKVLDHQSQSGGERAVSTIFFIMSLQGLTNAPIRIVDEINQGMDPKNEKMAHKYLVNTACSNESSQYFLVTPKLLTGLYYHPDMAVHCIFTGPYLQGRDSNRTRNEFLDMSA